MKIAVLYGGKTGEHEVSLVSASSVVRNLDPKHELILIGIAKDARWFLQPAAETQRIKSDPQAILSLDETGAQVSLVPGGGAAGGLRAGEKSLPVDIVFPVLHGQFGEDGTVQGLFEMAELPYVGAGVTSSALSMDKEKTKQIWLYENLPVVPFVCIKKYHRQDAPALEKLLQKAERDFLYPLFVKPCNAGSSIGTGSAKNRPELLERLEQAFLWDDKVLIEPFVPAIEVECSVTGNGDVTAYTPGQIVPTHEFYDYDAKYTDPDGAALKIPADLDDSRLREVRELAVRAYRALDLNGLSRVDFFIDKQSGKLYLNEVNTMPGFTSISMFPKMCEASGLPYPQLLQKLVDLGISYFRARRAIKTSR